MFTHRSRTRSYRRPQAATSSPFRYRLHCEALELRAVPAALGVPELVPTYLAGGTVTAHGSPSPVGLTPAQKGLMVAVPVLSGALLRLVAGVLVDHIGPKLTGAIGQLVVLGGLAVATPKGPSRTQVMKLRSK